MFKFPSVVHVFFALLKNDKIPIFHAEIVLKNNIFEFDEKTVKQKRVRTIATKFASPYPILYMADLEEKPLEIFEKKPNDMVEVHR